MIAFNTDGKNIDIKRYRVTLTKEKHTFIFSDYFGLS